MKKLIVYTDGSCQPNPGEGSYGAIIMDSNCNPLYCIGGYHQHSTNNIMEAYAFYTTLLTIKEPSSILFYSDSQYCVNIINRKWKASKNRELWFKIFVLMKDHKVEAKWVKGHNTSKWNNLVDELCTYLRKEKVKNYFKEGF